MKRYEKTGIPKDSCFCYVPSSSEDPEASVWGGASVVSGGAVVVSGGSVVVSGGVVVSVSGDSDSEGSVSAGFVSVGVVSAGLDSVGLLSSGSTIFTTILSTLG